MRIHDLRIPAGQEFIYICHAPSGRCRVLSQLGDVHDVVPNAHDNTLSRAEAFLFDPHWRGANATEIATHWKATESETIETKDIGDAVKLLPIAANEGPAVSDVRHESR